MQITKYFSIFKPEISCFSKTFSSGAINFLLSSTFLKISNHYLTVSYRIRLAPQSLRIKFGYFIYEIYGCQINEKLMNLNIIVGCVGDILNKQTCPIWHDLSFRQYSPTYYLSFSVKIEGKMGGKPNTYAIPSAAPMAILILLDQSNKQSAASFPCKWVIKLWFGI